MENFSDVAKSAWIDRRRRQTTFCVPMASVIHGFIYNKDAFDKLGIAVPTTEAEFFAALDKIKADGTYIPMAMGTNDQWEAATMGYQNIGPNYWKGEEGRQALIKGEQKLTDAHWVEPYADACQVEGLSRRRLRGADLSGQPEPVHARPRRRSIRPARGKSPASTRRPSSRWAPSRRRSKNAGDTCYISDHTDIAIGLNAKSRAMPDAAKTFLDWVASPEFADDLRQRAARLLLAVERAPVKMDDPLAQEFVSWRDKCKSTIRSTYQILSRGTPNLENETWDASANVINGTETPEAAGKQPAGRPRQLVQAGK